MLRDFRVVNLALPSWVFKDLRVGHGAIFGLHVLACSYRNPGSNASQEWFELFGHVLVELFETYTRCLVIRFPISLYGLITGYIIELYFSFVCRFAVIEIIKFAVLTIFFAQPVIDFSWPMANFHLHVLPESNFVFRFGISVIHTNCQIMLVLDHILFIFQRLKFMIIQFATNDATLIAVVECLVP